MKEWLIFLTENAITIHQWPKAVHNCRRHDRSLRKRSSSDAFFATGPFNSRDLVVLCTLAGCRSDVPTRHRHHGDVHHHKLGSDWAMAAVAVVRTFFNYFLERDLTEIGERQRAIADRSA
jgi:hypothetical protein